MATILQGGVLVEFEPACVEPAALRIEDGKITARGDAVVRNEGDEVIELGGRLVFPGLVSGHHQPLTTLMRGQPAAPGFAEGLRTRHQMEAALDLDACEAVAAAGALEGLLSGVTTVFELHASPKCISGSLARVARGVGTVGLRGVLGYQVSERLGAMGREAGLEECADYFRRARGRFRGLVGATSLAHLSDDGIEGFKNLHQQHPTMLHLEIGEDPTEEDVSTRSFSSTPINRLVGAGLIDERTVLSQLCNVAWPDLSQLLSSGSWLVHCARSNMDNHAGTAPAGKFGVRATFGTHATALDVFAEAQCAYYRARDSGQPINPLRFLANGHRLASAVFGGSIGPLREGALADLLIIDYRPATPLTAQTLPSHLMHGLSARHVESVMVDGVWRLWARKPLGVKPDEVINNCRESSKAVFERFAEAQKP